MTKCSHCAEMGRYRCYCSRKTSLKVRAHMKAVSVKGGKASGRKKQMKAIERWKAMVKGLTPAEAWRRVYRQGYNCGLMVGQRAGYAKGWEACAKAMRVA